MGWVGVKFLEASPDRAGLGVTGGAGSCQNLTQLYQPRVAAP